MYVQQNKPLEDIFPAPPENYSGHAFRRAEAQESAALIGEPPTPQAPQELPQDIPQETPAKETEPTAAAATEVFASAPPPKRQNEDLLLRLLPRGIRQLLGGLGSKESGSLLELLLPLAIIYLTWDSDDALLPLLLLFIFL